MPSENADVSVVVTVKNDPRVIECAEQVLAQRTSFRFDLVVVDNGSTDETAPRLSIRFDGDRRVTLLSSGGNLSESWNHGAKAASGRVLVRIDADAIPLPGWLEALAAPLLLGEADWTAGPVGGVSPKSSLVARYYHERTEAYSRRLERDPELRDAVPSWNVAYRRDTLEAGGWYDPWQASSVDWDLHKRLKLTGSRGKFVSAARVIHHHPETFSEFAKKEAWYRTGQYQMALKYGVRVMSVAFLLPLGYGLLIVFAVFSFVWRPLAWLTLLLFLGLITKHWFEGIREGDPLWAYRALFRPIEGLAGLYGLLRGVARYGVRRRRPSMTR